VAHLTIAFFVFRFFDILKPWPCRQLERLPGGLGIVVDDVAAGVWSWLVMAALYHFFA
jgi:phosphatidylglycerophosphatase A